MENEELKKVIQCLKQASALLYINRNYDVLHQSELGISLENLSNRIDDIQLDVMGMTK